MLESKSAELIGFGAAGLERENQDETAGEIYALYLLQEHQGKGLGKQLFLEVAKKLESEGYQSMMLWVLADNPACKFYEAMGGTATRQKDIDIKQNTLIEVAYEWQQLDVIAG